MNRASAFVIQFLDALSSRQHISLKISTTIIFDLSQRQQDHNTATGKEKLRFLLSSWQHLAGILPLGQWLCRKSTTWYWSRRMRSRFSPMKPNTVGWHCAWANHYLKAVICTSRGGFLANERETNLHRLVTNFIYCIHTVLRHTEKLCRKLSYPNKLA